MKNIFILFASALLSVLLSSCYYHKRTTTYYHQFPDISESKSAIVNEKDMTEEEMQLRQEILRKLEEEEAPPYSINAGDSLSIVVYNHPELNTNCTVTPDGYVGMVFVGQVKVADLTLEKAAKKIEGLLTSFIRNPVVGVTTHTINSETVSIVGAVGSPGMYTISNGMRLADLYAKVGGSSVRLYDGKVLDAADLVNSIFIRRTPPPKIEDEEGRLVPMKDSKGNPMPDKVEILPIDFRKAIEQGEQWNNVKLRKGDYIYVAVRSESMVCLLGEVRNPHKHLWDNNLGVLELITNGGGLAETYWPYAIIIRGGVANPKLYKVDVDGILHGRKPNVALEPGDIVYVPKDDITEFNVFVRKLLPSGELFSLLTSPINYYRTYQK